jgi:ribosomal protein S18 acetylase RimI-like enzyme
MSDERLDALAEMARNRGLKLVRSRVRTPGKRRFGKAGLTDPHGKAVFGMDAKGPAATVEEVEDYLRNLGAKDWGASLDVAVLPRKRKATRQAAPREAANDREPAPKPEKPKPEKPKPEKPRPAPKPRPEPVLNIREAKPADAPRLAELMKLLGHDVDAKGVRKRLAALARDDLPQLLATLDKKVVGLAGIHSMIAIHRDRPVGRITILVVAEEARRRGVGRMLAEAAEDHLRKRGCGMVEVTSNDRLTAAHAFYRHMGYERTSIRFMKKL